MRCRPLRADLHYFIPELFIIPGIIGPFPWLQRPDRQGAAVLGYLQFCPGKAPAIAPDIRLEKIRALQDNIKVLSRHIIFIEIQIVRFHNSIDLMFICARPGYRTPAKSITGNLLLQALCNVWNFRHFRFVRYSVFFQSLHFCRLQVPGYRIISEAVLLSNKQEAGKSVPPQNIRLCHSLILLSECLHSCNIPCLQLHIRARNYETRTGRHRRIP